MNTEAKPSGRPRIATTRVGVSMIALSIFGLLATPSVADAQSRCERWGFAGATRIVEPETGWQVNFYSNGTRATGDATASNNRGESKTGQVSGGMNGGRFDVVVDYDNGQQQYYRGGVYGGDGVASGKTSSGITNENGKQFTALVACLDGR